MSEVDVAKYEERASAAEKQIEQLRQKIAELEAKSGSTSSSSGSLKSSDNARSFFSGFLAKHPENATSHKFSKRSAIVDVLAQGEALIDQEITVAGWAKTIRAQGGGRFTFVELNDGSSSKNLQVIIDKDVAGFDEVSKAATGASVLVTGIVVKSIGKNQTIELKSSTAELLSGCDAAKYPLAKKNHTPEHLREVAHLRSRTNLFSAATRIRNACSYATHKFFQENGFFYIHTPLITASDCEGAGELFTVTTLLKDNISEIPVLKDSQKVDYSKDFFSKKSYLTVSGQLNVETFACGLSKVYTFGPTFRAEDSHTVKHLAEFWMIEPEIAFADLADDMNYAEAYLKYCTQFVLDHCYEELKFCDQWVEKGLLARLANVLDNPFARVSYTTAVEQLIEVQNKGHKFVLPVEWGMDLKTEHERYIVENIYKKPVILHSYPKDIKAFYMRMNEDGKTVAAMDILVPKIGEVIGGSQREERLDHLEKRIDELKLIKEAYSWYLDLRRYGSVMHSGFGLGLERLIMFVSGIENIRDVIPFPRWPGHAEF